MAEEIFITNNISNDFYRSRFFRGITLPPTHSITVEGRLADESKFPVNVMIA